MSTVGELLKTSTHKLKSMGIESARLDTFLLLEDITKKDRAYLLAHTDEPLSAHQTVKLNKKIAQRSTGLPLAYIRGKASFFGRTFFVTKSVLVPRPESESILQLLKKIDLRPQARIADIGTGSGCIGITAALELDSAKVDLYDIRMRALHIAARNADALGAKVGLHWSNVLQAVHKPYDVVLANLPYVPENMPINQGAAFEPRIAIFSGADGLAHYRQFWAQIAAMGKIRPRYVIIESFPSQRHIIALLARKAGFYLTDQLDFATAFSCQ